MSTQSVKKGGEADLVKGANALLASVGFEVLHDHFPNEESGGAGELVGLVLCSRSTHCDGDLRATLLGVREEKMQFEI